MIKEYRHLIRLLHIHTVLMYLMFAKNEMLLKKNKVMRDHGKHDKDKLKMDDYLSALMDLSKNLRRNIDTYNDKFKSINSKLSTVTHTPNFI